MRYIIFKDFGDKFAPFLFPDKVEFMDMREQLPYATVLSCGNVFLKDGKLACSGGDKELGVNSLPSDVEIISSCFLGSETD